MSLDSGQPPIREGSLTVVGTGIEFATQLTPQAHAAIVAADDVPYLVADPVTAEWLKRLNPAARSLGHLYRDGRPRSESYEAIAEEIVASIRRGRRVCAVFYGHPGVFVHPSHEAVRRARAEGWRATMQPAISAEACLIADLGVDPGRTGWQSYEATNFVVYGRQIDPTAALVLWQVGALGQAGFPVKETTPEQRRVLIEVLLQWYPAEHEVTLYEASQYALFPPEILRLPLGKLEATAIAPGATLYVPPAREPVPDATAVRRLGL